MLALNGQVQPRITINVPASPCEPTRPAGLIGVGLAASIGGAVVLAGWLLHTYGMVGGFAIGVGIGVFTAMRRGVVTAYPPLPAGATVTVRYTS